jgi:exosortase E/protease (VPEID-CTERM system)
MTMNPMGAPVACGGVRPWSAVIVAIVAVFAQVVLVDRMLGDAILQIIDSVVGQRIFRSDFCTTVIVTCIVVHGFVRRQPDMYRLATLSLPRLVAQILVFLTFFGCLAAAAAGLLQTVIGSRPTDVAVVLLGIGWVSSMLLLLPSGSGSMARAAAFAGGLTLAGIGLTRAFWGITVDATMVVVEWMLASVTESPVIRPERCVIGTPEFSVFVGYRCSGVQGVLLVSLFLAAYLWWFRRVHRFPQALLLVPIGIGLMFLANAARITALILVGIWLSPKIAVEGFHSYAGWLAFLAVAFGTIWTASRLSIFTRRDAALPESSGGGMSAPAEATAATPIAGPSVTACLLPFLLLILTTLLTGAFSTHDSIDVLYPVRVLVVGAVMWSLRHEFRWQEARLSPLAVGLGALVFIVWMLLAPTTADEAEVARQDPAQLGPIWGDVWLVVRVIGYTMTVPIAEELAFRGFLTRRLINVDVEGVPPGTFTWISFLGSSLAFGALHQAAWIPGTIAGFAFAAALYHRRRLGDAIVAHATTNALLSFYVIGTGAWASWG